MVLPLTLLIHFYQNDIFLLTEEKDAITDKKIV